MGKLMMGILGGFSGKVGTVVGSTTRKGDDLIRARTKRTRTSNTDGQLKQRTKFSLVMQFFMTLNILLKIGFKGVAGFNMSPYNYACKKALTEAIISVGPDFELDYGKVLISQGLLSRETISDAVLMDGNVTFHWENNTGSGNCATTDKAVLLVYNVDKNELSYSIGTVTRGLKTGVLPLPYSEIGDKMVFYMFFQSESDPTLVSTSQFLGSVEVTELLQP